MMFSFCSCRGDVEGYNTVHRLFPGKIVIYLTAVFFLLVWLLWNSLNGPSNASVFDFFGFVFRFCGVLAALISVLGIPRVFGFLVRLIAKRSIYDISGLYRVEMTSNWPMIDRLISAAGQTGESFDVHAPADGPRPLPVMGFAIIEAGMFDMKIKMRMSKTTHESVSRGEDIRKDEHGRVFLRYVYVQTNAPHGTPPTDVSQHSGAAELVFDPKADELGCLSGRYWTNRNYAKGMNTAGDIKLIRIKRNEYKFPSPENTTTSR